MAVAGFVCGLVGLIFFWIPFLGLIIAALGLVFGILGKRHADQHGGTNGGLAIAGAILGGLGVAAGILIIIAIVNTAHDSSGFINQIQTCLQTPSAPGC
jgi:hypothetical protein